MSEKEENKTLTRRLFDEDLNEAAPTIETYEVVAQE